MPNENEFFFVFRGAERNSKIRTERSLLIESVEGQTISNVLTGTYVVSPISKAVLLEVHTTVYVTKRVKEAKDVP